MNAAWLRRWLSSACLPAIRQPAAAMLAGLLFSGCVGSKPAEISRPAADSLITIQAEISKLRGLAFKPPVTFSDKPAPASADVAAEYQGQAIGTLAHVYNRLGLLPESADFRKALLEFSRLQRMIDYDASRAMTVAAPEAGAFGKALAGPQTAGATMIPAVLALVHALQEQHFRWHTRLGTIPLQDRNLAFRAVACGDALLVALKYLSGHGRDEKFSDQLDAIARLAAEFAKIGSSLPAMLRHNLLFPCQEGGRFAQWAFAARGWSGVNALFSDPPFSSAQILHPENYYKERKLPVRIVPFGLFAKLSARPLVEQMVGESLIALVLEAGRARQEAAQIAAGWEGDHLSAYSDGDNTVTAWFTAWRDVGAARAFHGAYQTVLERRHRLRFEPAAHAHGIQAHVTGGRASLLEVRGPLVLLLDGVAWTRAVDVSESAWENLETSIESSVIPFDSAAAGSVHSSNR